LTSPIQAARATVKQAGSCYGISCVPIQETKDYLIGTDLNGQGAFVTSFVGGILTIVHLGITAPLKRIREGIEVVPASHILVTGCVSACTVYEANCEKKTYSL